MEWMNETDTYIPLNIRLINPIFMRFTNNGKIHIQWAAYLGKQSQDLMLRSTVSFPIVKYSDTFLSFNDLSNCYFPCPLSWISWKVKFKKCVCVCVCKCVRLYVCFPLVSTFNNIRSLSALYTQCQALWRSFSQETPKINLFFSSPYLIIWHTYHINRYAAICESVAKWFSLPTVCHLW